MKFAMKLLLLALLVSCAPNDIQDQKNFTSSVFRRICSVLNEYKYGVTGRILARFGILDKKKLRKDLYFKYQKSRDLVLEKLRKEKRKLRVCFLVSENQKWNAQSIYNAMEKSEDFYPFVVVTRLSDVTGRTSLQHNVEFFKNCCKNVEIGFDERTNRSIDLKSFKPDIVFYQQPWDIYENQSPIHILDCALSYYFSYGIGSVSSVLNRHIENFYLALQKHFVFSEEEKQQCIGICNYLDLTTSVVGHPKLDVYNDYDEKKFQKKYVIYAPHHSFPEDSLLNYGTFDWNGKYILEWAKSHPELSWVFKPHPLLKQTLFCSGAMTPNEIKQYYQDWTDIGICYNDGNYFDLFKNSRCLITDCGSFLTEYFPTKNPVIHLRNPKGMDYSANNKIIMRTYYDVWNIEQLRSYLEDILLNGNDIKQEERLSLLKKLKIGKDNCANKIIRELKKDVGRINCHIKNYAIILASGRGCRYRNFLPKQFEKIAGKTILEHTVEVFENSDKIDSIVVVVTPEYTELAKSILHKNDYKKIEKLLKGGPTRKESSYIGVHSIEEDEANVFIHDCARPFLTQKIINNCMDALNHHNAIDVAIPSTDTIIEVEDGFIKNIPDRFRLMRGQTPQCFKLSVIKKAHDLSKNELNFTDDCSLILKHGLGKIYVVEGDVGNIKITYPNDIYMADRLFQIKGTMHPEDLSLEKLKGKVIVIFGGTSGIGRSTASIAKKFGANVYITSDRLGCDVSKYQDVEKFLKDVYKKIGRIDHVINTAGILRIGKLVERNIEDIKKDIKVNYLGSVNVVKASVPYLKKSKGSVQLYASSSYTRGRALYSTYSSTKAGIVNLVQALSEELHSDGIRINVINPERTATPMRFMAFGKEPEESLLKPEKVAEASLKTLLSRLTGQIIDVRRNSIDD